ncbi:MAG TPA: MFS transporter [Caulobacteraceae bacterium]|nr:MFS transporter [Caulobacteraceae bacterium]
MAFFSNDAINRINFHYAIQALAMGAGGIFFLAYLLHAGVPIPATLLAQAAILAGRFAWRPAILPIGKRWGLKPIVVTGVLVIAGEYPLLAQVHGVDLWLGAFCLAGAVGDTLYWSGYHAYFAALGDPEHRGHQVGAREAMAAVIGIAAPLAGGWALVTLGPRIAFAAVAVVQALSALPLLAAPNVPVLARAPGAFRAARLGMALFVADGWMGACFGLVWQVVLFVSLGGSLAAYGGAMALAALVGAIAGLLLGRHIDRGGGRRAALISFAVTTVVVVLRAASLGSPWLAVGANALGALAGAVVVPAMMTAAYNLSLASPCPLRFQIACEGGWDVGCAGGCVIAAGLSAMGQPLSIAILLALPGAAVTAWMLRGYYGRAGGAAEAIAPAAAPP